MKVINDMDSSLVFGVFKLMKWVSEYPSYITDGEHEYPRELFIVLGQMTYPVASLTPDSIRSYMMQGAPFTQGMIPSIPIGGSISPEGFLSSILLLVFIGIVVVVGGVSSIFKLLFVIIGVLRRIMFYYLFHQHLSYGNGFLQSLSLLRENIDSAIKQRMRLTAPSLPFEVESLLAIQAAARHQAISCWMGKPKRPDDEYGYPISRDKHSDKASKFIRFLEDGSSSNCLRDVVDLTGDEDPTDEDGDTEMGDLTGVSVSLGG
ncbi:hypothetical protein Tco_1556378 [Tanacetum coccineum]